MAKKPVRARTQRRSLDRDTEKLRRDLARLYAAEADSSPERPRQIASASQVEPDASSRACPYCEGQLRVDTHEMATFRGRSLRVARLVCRSCHARWNRYYRLLEAMPN